MACRGGNAKDKSKMNGRISRLPVAMVSAGLVGKAVTRQLERDQDKGKLVRGRCQCIWGGGWGWRMRWEGERKRNRHSDRGRIEGNRSKGR